MASSTKETVCGKPSKQQYSNYGKTKYNARTYKKDIEEFI